MNSLTAGNVQLTLPYGEALNDLINYNSELTYSPSSSQSSQNQRTAPLDISRKLPTKLSKNPTTYEKELRQLVIDLYSDKELSKELNQSPDMSSFSEIPVLKEPGVPVVQGPGVPVVQGPEVPVVQEPGVIVGQMSGLPVGREPGRPVVEEPKVPVVHDPPSEGASYWGVQRVIAPQPLDMLRMTETSLSFSESGSEGYCSQDNSASPAEESGIQSLQELQGYLVKLQNSKQGILFLVDS